MLFTSRSLVLFFLRVSVKKRIVEFSLEQWNVYRKREREYHGVHVQNMLSSKILKIQRFLLLIQREI